MVIKASAAAEIRHLIEALGAEDDVRREAAVARLSVLGARAVDRLVAAYRSAPTREMKVAVLRALEVAGDRRIVAVSKSAIQEGGDVAIAAVAALAAQIESTHAATAAEVLDVLVAAALDPAKEKRVRVTAYQAIQHIPQVGDRIAAALRSDPDAGLKAAALDAPRDKAATDAIWQDALEGRLPDEPGLLREVALTKALTAPLGALQKMIDAVRAVEGSLPAGHRRDQWRAARGALHQALALRGSRVAVYDLRETIEEAQRTPAGLIPRRPARRRRRVVRRVTCRSVCAHAVRGGQMAAPARRGVPRDYEPREDHAATPGIQAHRLAMARCGARAHDVRHAHLRFGSVPTSRTTPPLSRVDRTSRTCPRPTSR